jgi:hypothetical protein
VNVLLAAGIAAIVAQAWHGRPPAVRDGMRALTSRGAALIVTAILFTLGILAVVIPPMMVVVVGAVVGSNLALALGVIVALIIAVAGFIFITLRWSLYTQTTVLEEKFALDALGRSSELMKGRGLPFLETPKFKLSVIFLVTIAIAGTLQSLFALPRLAIAMATGWSFADGMPPLSSMPLWFIFPFGLLEVCTNALVVPFSGTLLTLFYFDLRVRFEGLDADGERA